MHIRAHGYDELQAKVMAAVVESPIRANPRRGPIRELPGVLLELVNPRIRLSRTESRALLFSCLGEFLWYLSGQDDLATVAYYIPNYADNSDDKRTLWGAYGPRLFRMHGHDQVQNVLGKLRKDPDSRQAVIQLFSATDIAAEHGDVPCTCTLQFLLRDKRLHMITHMRSNDVVKGLPHDIFAFTMLQEILARSLGCDVGPYKHMVGSLHLYEADLEKARTVIKGGFPPLLAMPSMPIGDPWTAIELVLKAERAIRLGSEIPPLGELEPYWMELVTLLNVHKHLVKDHDREGAERLKTQVCTIYQLYIDQKLRRYEKRRMKRSKAPKNEQTRLGV